MDREAGGGAFAIRDTCIIAGSKAPFSVNIGETLTVDDLKKAAKSEKMLELDPLNADALKLYK